MDDLQPADQGRVIRLAVDLENREGETKARAIVRAVEVVKGEQQEKEHDTDDQTACTKVD